jgi:hypothetical protein
MRAWKPIYESPCSEQQRGEDIEEPKNESEDVDVARCEGEDKGVDEPADGLSHERPSDGIHRVQLQAVPLPSILRFLVSIQPYSAVENEVGGYRVRRIAKGHGTGG